MSQSDQKVVQYLSEAHASELALVSVLESQIVMTPRGSYRDALEKHLDETRTHAGRVQERLAELGEARNPFQVFVGFTETVIGQMLAMSKAPFDLMRGSSGAEKVLKNAKDACASEELEIATYTALERLALKVGDEQTAKLAASIRRDEERMLKRVTLEIPKLTDAVVRAEIEDQPAKGMTEPTAADDTRETARRASKTARGRTRRTAPARASKTASARTSKTARETQAHAKRPKGQARQTASSTQADRQRKRSGAAQERLPIQRYRSLNTEQIISELPTLSESDLGKIDAFERKNKNRAAILSRIRVLRGAEPWAGYDQLTVPEIDAVLNEGDYQRAQDVLVYERAHKNRPEVIQSALVPARFVLSTSNA
jgi:ferritin-like metal-binding protein YciE